MKTQKKQPKKTEWTGKAYGFPKNYILDDIYTDAAENIDEVRGQWLADLKLTGVKRFETKVIFSGDHVEVESYPLYLKPCRNRAPKQNPSREKQSDLNFENVRKRVIRLLNTNFTSKNYWFTYNYDDAHLPASPEAANREMHRLLKKMKTKQNKAMKKDPSVPEFKYLFVTEVRDEDGKPVRVHHHLICNFYDRNLGEELWHGGERTYSRRLQPDDFGLEGMARYVTKSKSCYKRYVCSRNLDQPVVVKSSECRKYRISKKDALKIARGDIDHVEFYEKLLGGIFAFTDMAPPKESKFISGFYLRVRMRRRS